MEDHLPPVSTPASRKLSHAPSLSCTPRPGRADRRSIISTLPSATFTPSDAFFHTSSHRRQQELRSYRMLLALPSTQRDARFSALEPRVPVYPQLPRQPVLNTRRGVRSDCGAQKSTRNCVESQRLRAESRSVRVPHQSNRVRHDILCAYGRAMTVGAVLRSGRYHTVTQICEDRPDSFEDRMPRDSKTVEIPVKASRPWFPRPLERLNTALWVQERQDVSISLAVPSLR